MVQKQIRSLSKKGSVINTTVANATAKALISKYAYAAGGIDVNSSRWAKKLICQDELCKEMKDTFKSRHPR